MKELFNRLQNRSEQLALVGLGYVGMPIAVAFAEHFNVIGFDVNAAKIDLYRSGVDPTREVGDEAIRNTSVQFTADEKELQKAKFFVVAVPTPVNADNTPDLGPVIGASTLLGRNLPRGSVVVYESTVYPGVTEGVCVPILEKESGLKCGVDFKIGYSPERINPGDKKHRLQNITKVVSGMDDESLALIADVYATIIEAGVHRAPTIRVAEACKVAENSQRDINIAFVNELALIFDRMGIDTCDVLEAMATKWNAVHFYPGLVGGHCIGVDPFYLVHVAEELGYHSQVIAAGRRVNDGMGPFVADTAIREMILAGKTVRDAKVVILGLTFKEDCPDTRNTKVMDIIDRLRAFGVSPIVADPQADAAEARLHHGVELVDLGQIHNADCVILAVAHAEFKAMSPADVEALFAPGEHVLIDVKGLFAQTDFPAADCRYWRL